MHELGIAAEVVAVAVAEAEKHGAKKVTRVQVEVGVLRGVVPENLTLMFAHVARGTLADGAQLLIEEEPATLTCPDCGPSPAARFTLDCPACGKTASSVTGGESLRIRWLDLED